MLSGHVSVRLIALEGGVHLAEATLGVELVDGLDKQSRDGSLGGEGKPENDDTVIADLVVAQLGHLLTEFRDTFSLERLLFGQVEDGLVEFFLVRVYQSNT